MRRRTLLLAAAGATLPGCGADRKEAAPGPSPSAFDLASYQPPAVAADELRAIFTYDPAPPVVTPSGSPRDNAGVRVAEVRYADIPAFLVTPTAARARMPGVVYAAGSDVPGDVWLAEASELVRLGAVALMPAHRFAISGDVQRDTAHMRDTVIAHRRGIDVLAAHPGVDPARLAFVGHSWGGVHSLILSGIEPRLAAIVPVAVGGRFSRFAYRRYQPADGRAYLDQMSRFDGLRYVTMPGQRRLMFQFGRRDDVFDRAETDELAAAAAGPAERRDYDAGHNLVPEPAAAADRLAFLRRALRL